MSPPVPGAQSAPSTSECLTHLLGKSRFGQDVIPTALPFLSTTSPKCPGVQSSQGRAVSIELSGVNDWPHTTRPPNPRFANWCTCTSAKPLIGVGGVEACADGSANTSMVVRVAASAATREIRPVIFSPRVGGPSVLQPRP